MGLTVVSFNCVAMLKAADSCLLARATTLPEGAAEETIAPKARKAGRMAEKEGKIILRREERAERVRGTRVGRREGGG